MKIKLSSLIYSVFVILTFSITANSTAQNNEVDRVQEVMREVEKDNCKGTTEVNYRSQKLTSSDGQITIYFEGVLRRIGERGDFSTPDGYCKPLRGRQTPITTLLVEKSDSNLQKISWPAEKGSYSVLNPVSFSPNNRYLIVEAGIGYDGGDGETSYIIIDTQEKYKILDILICHDSSYGVSEYNGFISSSEILLECGNGVVIFEVVNLDKKTVRKVLEPFTNSTNTTKLYGEVSGEMTVLKRQAFPPRR